MDLGEARALLARHDTFEKGEAVVDGRLELLSDRLWEALLSLEDAAELVTVANRLDWQFHPRGFDNVELYERYGDGIVPFLATRLDDDGILHNVPWCVVPCLLRCGSVEAFDLAWRVVDIAGRTPWGGCGDADLLLSWCQRHPEVAREQLAHKADAKAKALLFALGGPIDGAPTEDAVLALLDACAARQVDTRVELWPGPEVREVRAAAFRHGDDWGLAIEHVRGTRPRGLLAAHVVTCAFGPRVEGPVRGATVASRPVQDFDATELAARVGAPTLALPTLGLPRDARLVGEAVLARPAVPSESPALAGLVAQLCR
ncbi:MAG: hypothetical protein H6737_11780 [Alphaproteobacteria bacterium]|nr:hypothetical protein [Alphaproteobacteria bacterium]